MIQAILHSKPLSKWALIAYWTTMFVATHWPEIDRYKPEEGWPIPDFEFVMHFAVYGGFVVMWWWVLLARGRALRGMTLLTVLLGGAVYGALDEITQAIVERQPALDDWAFDVIGMILAAGVLRAVERFGRIRPVSEIVPPAPVVARAALR